MARTIRRFDVFIASPGDVSAERDAIEDVVEELNRHLGPQQGVELYVLKSETHSYPGKGEDAQDVINSQIQNTFDIFIGIFWHRIGTPTNRAISGTVEEFASAHDKWKEDANSVHISLYFKTAAISPSEIDPEQLRSLQIFKSEQQRAGFLTCDFTNTENFKSLVRNHLQRITVNLNKQNAIHEPQTVKVLLPPDNAIADNPEELGLFEHSEQFQAAIGNATSILTAITEALLTLANKSEEASETINQALKSKDKHNSQRALTQGVVALSEFADFVDDQLPGLDNTLSRAMDSLDGMIELTPDFADGISSMMGTLPNIEEMLGKIDEMTLSSIDPLISAIEGIPRITSPVRKARRKAKESLCKFVEILANFKQRMIASKELIQSLAG